MNVKLLFLPIFCGVLLQIAVAQVPPSTTLKPVFGKPYIIKSLQSGRVLQVDPKCKIDAGCSVGMALPNGGKNQQWTVNPIGMTGEHYEINNVGFRIQLDLAKDCTKLFGCTAIGVPIPVFGTTFRLIKTGLNYSISEETSDFDDNLDTVYTSSDRVLVEQRGNGSNRVASLKNTNKLDQSWRIELANTTGSVSPDLKTPIALSKLVTGKFYVIKSVESGRVLQVNPDCKLATACSVGTSAPNGGQDQQWTLSLENPKKNLYRINNVAYDIHLHISSDCEEFKGCVATAAAFSLVGGDFELIDKGGKYVIREDEIFFYDDSNLVTNPEQSVVVEATRKGVVKVLSVPNINQPERFWRFELAAAKGTAVVAPKAPAADVVIAGKGWGKVAIGATATDIENLLGKPDPTGINGLGWYNQLGITVIYFDNKAYSITFESNGMLSFSGKLDKGLRWGSTPAQIIAAYGKPDDRKFVKPTDKTIEQIIYRGIIFTVSKDGLNKVEIK